MEQTEVQVLLTQHPQYRLRSFAPVLQPVLDHVGGLAGLRGKDVLELGPGRRMDPLRF